MFESSPSAKAKNSAILKTDYRSVFRANLNQEEKSCAAQDRILAAAQELFATQGYNKATM